jgi:acetylornithine deacetylase/succinyl-diaminopimelate desuccinylase-like protein
MDTTLNEALRSQVLEWIDQDAEKIVALFSELVKCPTPSPPGDTRAAMRLVRAFLDAEGLPSRELNALEPMPNMISSIQMSCPGRHLMFNGHLDVLPAGAEPGWEDDPWSGKVADGRVWGRGTSDMKAGVTAMLFAYRYLARLSPRWRGKVSLTLVSDEETGFGRGTGYLFQEAEAEMLADAVISGEPSGAQSVCFSSKGYIQFSVRVTTRGAISGYPNESPSAIRIAAQIMAELDALEHIQIAMPSTMQELLADEDWCARHDEHMGEGAVRVLPQVSVNVGTIQGGSAASVISPDCLFGVSIVVPPGADCYAIFAEAKAIVARFGEAELFLEGIDPPDISSVDGELARILQDTVEGLGMPRPDMTPAVAISDCRYWRYRGTPAYWYGPNAPLCSAANESVGIDELLHTVRTHTLAAITYLSGEPLPKSEREGACSAKLEGRTITAVAPVLVARKVCRVSAFTPKHIDPALNDLFDGLYKALTEAGVEVGGEAIAEFEVCDKADGGGVWVTAAFPVPQGIHGGASYEVVELAGIELASTAVHRGPVDKTGKSWSALRSWARSKGYSPQEIYRERYVVGAPSGEGHWATELVQPVTPR